jgi:hypothetical protein
LLYKIALHFKYVHTTREQLNISAYADDIALIGKNEIEIRKLFVEMENVARKFGIQINQEKTKYDSGKEKQFKEK